jgi:hypothetical protein
MRDLMQQAQYVRELREACELGNRRQHTIDTIDLASVRWPSVARIAYYRPFGRW